MKDLTIEQAKEFLESKGYYTETLWCTQDVTDRCECTEEQAQAILSLSLNNEATMDQIQFSINEFVEQAGFKEK